MNNKNKIDLHMHSNASDGLCSPGELIKIAANAGLAAVGLTDHDTIKGLPEASCAAKKYNLELVPGVEIGVLEENQEVHILGYYPQYKDDLKNALERVLKERYTRMDEIVGKLRKQGFKLNLEEVLAEAGNSAPGRLHLARLLLKKRYINSLEQAFSLYLNQNREAYVPRKTFTIKQAMSLLKEVKAIPVIAHPGVDGSSMLDKLIPLGLLGIEVFHPEHSTAQKRTYQKIALENNLLITGGSDYHGDYKRYGYYPQHLAISNQYLLPLKNYTVK